MRILVTIERLDAQDGVSVQTFDICRALAAQGHELHLLSMYGGSYESSYREFSVSVRRVPTFEVMAERPLAGLRALAGAAAAGRRVRPDLVYDQLCWSLPFSYAAARAGRAKLVSHVHGFGASATLLRLPRLTLPRVDRFVAVSSWMRDGITGYGVDPGRIEVVHNGIDVAAYPLGSESQLRAARSARGIPQEAFVVGFLGRIDENKGVSQLVEALRLLTTRLAPQPVHLIVQGPVAGIEYVRECKDRADGLPVTWLDNDPEVLTTLHASDVVAAPTTRHESFGRTVVEAMATGRPVVATTVGGLPEILTGEFTAGLVPPDDPGALADALQRTCGWRETDPDLALRSRDHVVAHFGLAATTARIGDILAAAV